MSASNPTPPQPVMPLNSSRGRQHLCMIEFSEDVNQPSHSSSDLHEMPPNKTRCRRVLTHVPHATAATASVSSDHRRSSWSKYLCDRPMMSAQQIDRCSYLSFEKRRASAFPSCSGAEAAVLGLNLQRCCKPGRCRAESRKSLKFKCFTATSLIFFFCSLLFHHHRKSPSEAENSEHFL